MSADRRDSGASVVAVSGGIGTTLYWVFRPSFAFFLLCCGVFTIVMIVVFTRMYWQERRPGQSRFPSPFFIFSGLGFVFLSLSLWLWIKPDTWPPREQAVDAIKKQNGEITVDEQAPGQPIVKVSFRSRWGRWGQSPFGDAELASLMPHLKALSELRTLDLYETIVTDRGLLELRELTQLKDLILGCPPWLTPKRLSENGVNDLRKALPKTRVFVEGIFTVPDPSNELESLKQFMKPQQEVQKTQQGP
jgi:hypothetical protein